MGPAVRPWVRAGLACPVGAGGDRPAIPHPSDRRRRWHGFRPTTAGELSAGPAFRPGSRLQGKRALPLRVRRDRSAYRRKGLPPATARRSRPRPGDRVDDGSTQQHGTANDHVGHAGLRIPEPRLDGASAPGPDPRDRHASRTAFRGARLKELARRRLHDRRPSDDRRPARIPDAGLLAAHANLAAYVERGMSRPAFQRALAAQLADFIPDQQDA